MADRGRLFQFRLGWLFLLMTVAALTFAAIRWFGSDSLTAIYIAVAPLLIPLVLSPSTIARIKWWLKVSLALSLLSIGSALVFNPD